MENLLFNYCKIQSKKTLGMKSSGSFTATRKLWMVFSIHDKRRILEAGGKPYGATMQGFFCEIKN